MSVNLFTVELARDEGDPPGYSPTYVRVGPLIGAEQLGLSVYELPPGHSVCPYHYEIGFEEWLIVLTGRPTLRTPEGERQLEPWDCAFFPDGDEPSRVAILSNKGDPGVAVFPDSQKVGVWPPDKLFRLADAVDYWDGE